MFNIHCISLQSKRESRFLKIYLKYKNENNINLIEEKAIEGTNKDLIIKLSKNLNLKFDDNASNGNKALFIKAYMLWNEFYNNCDDDYLFIIEDDVIPFENLYEKIKSIKNQLPTNYDFCAFIGENISGKNNRFLKDFNDNLYYDVPFSCIGAYMLSKSGAKKLIDLANQEIIKTHKSGAVMDYWVCRCRDQLEFFKTKNDFFYLLDAPSTLSVSRNKIIERYFPKLNNYLVDNFIINISLNQIGLKINGKITITFYIFFNFLFEFFLYSLIRNFLLVILLTVGFLYYDIKNEIYLHEEISCKILEHFLSFVILFLLTLSW